MAGKGSTITSHMPNEVADRLEEFRDDYELTTSQAVVRAADRGLAAYGYDRANGDKQTLLQRAMWELAKACVAAAATVVILALGYTFGFARFVGPLLLIAALCLTIVQIEPDISLRMGWE